MDRFKEAVINMGFVPAAVRQKMVGAILSRRVGSASVISTPPSVQNFSPDCFGQGFFIMGPDPKNLKSKPKVLYSVPEYNPDVAILSYCFPTNDVNYSVIDDPEKYVQHVMTEPVHREINFFVIYCPQATFSPYYFCATYRANIFTVPVLANKLTIDEMIQSCNMNSLPTFDVCIAVRANQPNHDAYLLFLEWVIRCEQYGRQEINPFINSYAKTRDLEVTKAEMASQKIKIAWPEQQRKNMKKSILAVIKK